MARKRVLVALDDDLVSRLDELALSEGASRSELLRRGAQIVIDAAEVSEADEQLREAYRRVPQDGALLAAMARLAGTNASDS